jgi:hypothetical protein
MNFLVVRCANSFDLMRLIPHLISDWSQHSRIVFLRLTADPVQILPSASMEYKGYTQYSGPEAWLYATYPQLHAIWRQAFANKDTASLNLELSCTICKVKPSSGQHYGVKICEADKQFLKRTFHYQLKYPPCTKTGEEGVCPPRPRGWCQVCRLRTCLATPINIAMIRVGDKLGGEGKNKKLAKLKKSQEPNPYTIQMTFQPNQEFQVPEHYSIADWPLAFPPPPSFQYYPTTTTPSFYDIPSFYRTRSPQPQDYSHPTSCYDEQNQYMKQDQDQEIPPVSQECLPLDLSVKPEPVIVDDDQWYTDELTFAEFPTKLLICQSNEEPLDLTKAGSTSNSPSKSCFTAPSFQGFDWAKTSLRPYSPFSFGSDSSRSSLSRPSSADGRIRSTPSPVLEASYGLNKLSVNSTALGDALAQIQANISASSLANLSSVSDILTDADK